MVYAYSHIALHILVFEQVAEQAAVNAACKLTELLGSVSRAINEVQLQHSLPASLPQRTADLFQQTSSHIAAFTAALLDFPKVPSLQAGLLEAVQLYRPVLVLGSLAAWLQRKPDLLQLPDLAAAAALPDNTLGGMWLRSLEAICALDDVVHTCEGSMHGYVKVVVRQRKTSGVWQ